MQTYRAARDEVETAFEEWRAVRGEFCAGTPRHLLSKRALSAMNRLDRAYDGLDDVELQDMEMGDMSHAA